MRRTSWAVLVLIYAAAFVTFAAVPAPQGTGYHLLKKVTLGGQGGWDYLTADPVSHRVFLSRGTHIMVVDADGKVVGDLKTSETNAAELARLMVGREVLLRVEKPEAKPGAPVLAVSHLSINGRDGGKRLNDVSFEVRVGEIVGIAGVEGNGQTELIEALAGLIPGSYISGKINFEDNDVTTADARKRKELGIAHVPEDRHRRGLLLVGGAILALAGTGWIWVR